MSVGTKVVRRSALAAAVAAASVSLALPAFAEEAQGNVLEEVIVTGTKRDISQQDAPIAISTITSTDIDKTFRNDIRAIGDLSPNVTLTNQTGFNALAGGIRGTGTISILTTQDPSVGLLIDEFALNHVQSQLVEMFDLEQVEVYRGPQGTLFGKNSTGGVIAITSKRPDLEQFGGQVKYNVGQYDVPGDSDNQKMQVGVDIPLIQGVLGLRFAGSYTKEDGYYTNDKDTAVWPNAPFYNIYGIAPSQCDGCLPDSFTTVPATLPTKGAGEQLGGKEVLASKTKLLWQPNDRYEAYFIWEMVRDQSDSPPGINESPPLSEGFLLPLLGFPGIHSAGHSNPFSTGMSNQGNGINIRDGHRVDVDGYYLNQSLSFDSFTIKSITGFREQMETLPSTYTGEAFVSLFDASRNLEREQFQQEVRFISEFEGPVNFVAGGIFLRDDLDFRAYSTVGLTSLVPKLKPNNSLDLVPGDCVYTSGVNNGLCPQFDLRALTNDPNAGRVEQDRDSVALYIDGTWDVTERLSLTAGTRWTQDEKEFYKPTGGGAPCNEFTDPRDVAPGTALGQPGCIDLNSQRVSRAGITGAEVSQRQIPLPDSQFRFIADEKTSWSEQTWRAVADYAVTDDQKAYFSIATGFLSGGYSETCSQEVTCVAYDPETNINYEIGYKADLFDRTLRLNAAVFYTEFEDLQRNQVFAFTNADGSPGQETVTLNAGKSHAKGLEIESTWLATERLTLKGSLGYLDAEYDEFEFDSDGPERPGKDKNGNPATIGRGVPVDLTNLDIPFAPELQLYGEISYVTPLSNGASIEWMASLSYQDEAETSPFDPNAADNDVTKTPLPNPVARHPTYTQMEERTLVNANVTYTSADERYYVTLYGLNLTDEEYRVTANSVGKLWNFTMYGPPMQWGMELGVTLE
jgi:iron complex outermembrane receptor protein